MDETSIDGQDLTGRHVVLKEGILKAEYRDITWRVVLAKGGFGCSPNTSGSAVFSQFVRDGEETRYERYDIERFATDEEVAASAAFRNPEEN